VAPAIVLEDERSPIPSKALDRAVEDWRHGMDLGIKTALGRTERRFQIKAGFP